ncbi:HSP20-like chaperone [Penicillium cataractarum]|uniref:HSP20-like chaperone n=1 Tax=Penicillium cataractarum TaxID=2100454 RepID=A0A9W9VVY1_9EURO|nr:HSP20-like chaperone [Penicillium cataractarum]KAJ5390144.1 HSP20-like chaperone [Penicillium cataractarum]
MMSLIPQFHRGGLSAISRILDNYENMFSNLEGHQAYAPSFDVRETEKAYYLDGDLPGVQQKDLKIEFENEHCLNIKAHSERESTSENGSWWVSERSVGDFRRTFNFPATIDQDHTQAHLKNGVLSLEVPKIAETHNRKKVDILD